MPKSSVKGANDRAPEIWTLLKAVPEQGGVQEPGGTSLTVPVPVGTADAVGEFEPPQPVTRPSSDSASVSRMARARRSGSRPDGWDP